eukprot:10915795-Prorocentrum_lima.AAC.1
MFPPTKTHTSTQSHNTPGAGSGGSDNAEEESSASETCRRDGDLAEAFGSAKTQIVGTLREEEEGS